jgi:uncharacterized membrane protein HdeD (DUF308 family)
MTNAEPSPFGTTSPLLKPLADNWWLILLRGLLAIVFGLIALIFPGIALLSFVWIFGVFAFVDGIFSIGAAITGGTMAPRWWLIIVGLAGIAVGILAVAWPDRTALILLIFIGAWAVVRGLFEIVGALSVRRHMENEWMLIAAGALSVLFGAVVLIAPGAGALALLWLIGAYAIVFGLMMVGFAFRLRTHRHAS